MKLKGTLELTLTCPKCDHIINEDFCLQSIAVWVCPEDKTITWTGQCPHCFEVLEVLVQ